MKYFKAKIAINHPVIHRFFIFLSKNNQPGNTFLSSGTYFSMVYQEIQRFNRTWIWLGLIPSAIAIAGLFGIGIYKQLVKGQKFGDHPMSDTALVIVFISVMALFILVALLFGFAKLVTRIDKNGISFKFFPFHFKFQRMNWEQIENCEVITYHPIRDYGGWGIKSNATGKAYSVSGDKGLQIYLKTGKIVLIGTRNEKELTDFITLQASSL